MSSGRSTKGNDTPDAGCTHIRWSRYAALIAASLVGFAPVAVAAQAVREVRSDRLYGTLGVSLASRIDRVISPSQFGGHGLSGSIGYEKIRGAFAFRFGAAGSESTLEPIASEASSRERLYHAELSLGALRAIGGSGFAAGIDLRGSMFLTRHRYADPHQSMATFFVAMAALSPTIAYERPTVIGIARFHAGIPVVALVSRPYSGLKSARRSIDFHGASVASLHSASAGFSLSAFTSRRVGMLYEYELRLVRYDDLQPMRGVEQSIRLGVEHRFGKRSP